MKKMVTAFLPLFHYALRRNNSTQTQVARSKGLTTNLLDRVARLREAEIGAGASSPFSLQAITLAMPIGIAPKSRMALPWRGN